MKKHVTCIFLVFFLILASAQAQTSSNSQYNLRKNVATVMFAGLAGAVLGLSTLSFYGEPQEHIGNIWLGLGIGALAGSAYVVSRSNPINQVKNLNFPTNPHQVQISQNSLINYYYSF